MGRKGLKLSGQHLFSYIYFVYYLAMISKVSELVFVVRKITQKKERVRKMFVLGIGRLGMKS